MLNTENNDHVEQLLREKEVLGQVMWLPDSEVEFLPNVYQKLQKVRVELQKMNLKKSGRNTFSNYDYFELGDFLPQINELFDKHQLFSQVVFGTEQATLTIINTVNPSETIVFTSPNREVTLKGAHSIQNEGAVQTYQRRYLYMTALEIVESDFLDATQGKDKAVQQTINKANTYAKPISEGQIKAINGKLSGLAKKHNLTLEEIKVKKKIGDITKMTSQEASKLISEITGWESK